MSNRFNLVTSVDVELPTTRFLNVYIWKKQNKKKQELLGLKKQKSPKMFSQKVKQKAEKVFPPTTNIAYIIRLIMLTRSVWDRQATSIIEACVWWDRWCPDIQTDRSWERKLNVAENTHIHFLHLPRMVCGLPRVWLVVKLPLSFGAIF